MVPWAGRATSIQALLGQREVAEEETKGAWREQLTYCLSTFAEGIITRKVNMNRAVAAHAAAMVALRGRVQQIRSPGGVPAPVKDGEQWKLG
ncbi:hypothetical protein [Thermomonospora umbrina]|uniref:hypothetical protein n=1 Tax=Thermomonospora umbrina TaxID=111806 RepID=UPI00147743DE|nr:hypothetical protein [Thermomonospora umbrina]